MTTPRTTSREPTRGSSNGRQSGVLTINEAALTTGWSSRMLRYIDELGLVTPPRSAAGYRLYGGAELQRLRTLRELLDRHQVSLTDLGFAVRMRDEDSTRDAVHEWIDTAPSPPEEIAVQTEHTSAPAVASAWLRFEQDKHQRLLAAVLQHPGSRHPRTPDPNNGSEPSHTSVKESA